jgi:hypothetical protein
MTAETATHTNIPNSDEPRTLPLVCRDAAGAPRGLLLTGQSAVNVQVGTAELMLMATTQLREANERAVRAATAEAKAKRAEGEALQDETAKLFKAHHAKAPKEVAQKAKRLAEAFKPFAAATAGEPGEGRPDYAQDEVAYPVTLDLGHGNNLKVTWTGKLNAAVKAKYAAAQEAFKAAQTAEARAVELRNGRNKIAEKAEVVVAAWTAQKLQEAGEHGVLGRVQDSIAAAAESLGVGEFLSAAMSAAPRALPAAAAPKAPARR